MRGGRGAASIIALAAWATSAMATPYHLPGKGEDFRPPPPVTVQLEAILSYALTGGFWIGIGARYWNLLDTTWNAPLSVANDPFQFSASLKTERWGAFIQGSYKFGRLEP
jgi:hypothetical protein